MVLAHTAINLPFSIWLILPFFDSLPTELGEAAELDGCSRFQTFKLIYLPLITPGLIVSGIFCFLFSWNDFLFSLVLAGSQIKTLPLFLQGYMNGFTIEWGPLCAASVLVLLPVLIFSLIVQRHLVSGLTQGGVKG